MNEQFVNEVCDALRQDRGFMESGRCKPQFEETLTDRIPAHLVHSSIEIEHWFKCNNIQPWKLFGIQSRTSTAAAVPLESLASYCKRMAEHNRAALDGAPENWRSFYETEAAKFELWERAVLEAI